jgi:CubicO group peptidase (beta-lactamase class C family)
MSAGLDWKGLTLGETNDDMEMYKTNDYFGFLLNKDLKFKSGTNFCYNNGLSLMLGHIIEKTSGLPVDSFAKEYLFNQLEINDYSWDIDENGIARTDGGLKLKPRDMLKFGQLYINNGKWNNNEIISENWIQNSTRQKITANNQEYAFHWWLKNYNVNNLQFRTIYALGHGEQAIILVPEQNLIFVMTAGNYLQVEHRPFEILKDYILPSITNTFLPEQEVNIEKFVGEYEINANEKIIIELIDNSLIAKDPSGAKYKLIPKSMSKFIIENTPREVAFVSNEKGSVIAAEVYLDGQRIDKLKRR